MSSLANLPPSMKKKIVKRRQHGKKKLENRIMGYIETLSFKEPVTVSDVNSSLRSKFYDYGRMGESKLSKEIEKCMEKMVKRLNPDINISTTSYTKADFYPQGDKKEDEEVKPIKTLGNGNVEIFDTDEGLMMNVKAPTGFMNNMLPSLKAKEEELNKPDDVASEKTEKTEKSVKSVKSEKSENKEAGKKRKNEDPIEKAVKRQKTGNASTFLNKRSYELQSDKRYSDLGGINDIIEEIKMLVEFPLKHPEIFKHLGVDPPRGILL